MYTVYRVSVCASSRIDWCKRRNNNFFKCEEYERDEDNIKCNMTRTDEKSMLLVGRGCRWARGCVKICSSTRAAGIQEQRRSDDDLMKIRQESEDKMWFKHACLGTARVKYQTRFHNLSPYRNTDAMVNLDSKGEACGVRGGGDEDKGCKV